MIPFRVCVLLLSGLCCGSAIAEEFGAGATTVEASVGTEEGTSRLAAAPIRAPVGQDAERPRYSLARSVIAQANGSNLEPAKARREDTGSRQGTRGSSVPQLPGALVAVIFGIFGVLVVSRRSARQ